MNSIEQQQPSEWRLDAVKYKISRKLRNIFLLLYYIFLFAFGWPKKILFNSSSNNRSVWWWWRRKRRKKTTNDEKRQNELNAITTLRNRDQWLTYLFVHIIIIIIIFGRSTRMKHNMVFAWEMLFYTIFLSRVPNSLLMVCSSVFFFSWSKFRGYYFAVFFSLLSFHVFKIRFVMLTTSTMTLQTTE